MSESGLRERKKRETRRNLSAAATRLFAERGFDAVTVAEVAKAADVSTKTVFNYFETKEDLVLEHRDELDSALMSALRERGASESIVSVVRRHTIELVTRVSAVPLERRSAFRKVFQAAPSVQARWRELQSRHELTLATLLAEQTGARPDDVEPQLVASLISAITRLAFGAGKRKTQAELVADIERACSLLERGLRDYGVRE
jgi:AcrR family transcriptional regulator